MTDKGAPTGLRERKKRATRAALVDAAVRLATEHGAENVTVEAISEAAGVSTRTFFNYFDTHDDVFVMIDAEIGQRLRQSVLDAPAELSPLEAVRDALAAELTDLEERHEVWVLRAQVLRKSPQLLVRGLAAHMSDELELARAIAERLGDEAGPDAPGAPGTPLGLYPRLLAGVAATAVRVAVEQWSADDCAVPFPGIFREAFDQLAAGLPAPAPATA